ncbi:anthranilate synthase family protein [Krasilnikovia sp. M28-CT-15]|uniref:anthranilate synthase family protein n=1 Tax=Krasilnikovia sp. M28-CT-15 TaxID=3373540 RepID=UPI003876B503
MTHDLLRTVLQPDPPPFALLHRPEFGGRDVVDVLIGETSAVDRLADLPLADDPAPGHELLALVPYRQIAERGFDSPDDDTPLLALSVVEQGSVPVAELRAGLPDTPIHLVDGHFDVLDDEYAETVRQIVRNEIGQGEGANFVVRRSFVVDITDYTVGSALTLFRRLLERESGAYWTFIVHTGERTLVGATPERHISLHDGVAVMNPISGTYRYPESGPTLDGVMDFLADGKETDELYMVVDEELKMMARICRDGGRVYGPYLKEMARLAHTEYIIKGRCEEDPRQILRETMFAPTVTGSPLESAARVIARYEPQGRGYYSGVLALIGRDEQGGRTLDSSILIRTADIDRDGRVGIGVGATLVRHSDPYSEVAETRAKVAGLIAALEADGPTNFHAHPQVRAALQQRNATIARFWLADDAAGQDEREQVRAALTGRRVLVVDAEDTFTSMIDHQLRSLDLSVSVVRFDEPYSLEGYDLVVMGPGPGDPRDITHHKIAHLRQTISTLLAQRRPFLAVCLSHQVLSDLLGFPLVRREVPSQGEQREIDLFGRRERVGFYNTFAAHSTASELELPGVGTVQVSRDPLSGEVHALRGPHFCSLQFHAESVLTQGGVRLVGELISELLDAPVASTR